MDQDNKPNPNLSDPQNIVQSSPVDQQDAVVALSRMIAFIKGFLLKRPVGFCIALFLTGVIILKRVTTQVTKATNQNGTHAPNPNQPDLQNTPKQPSTNKQDTKRGKFSRARVFLFILLAILILLFNTNLIVVSIIPIMLIILGIDSDLFLPISNTILKYTDKLIAPFFKPFKWIWNFLSIHPRRLGDWLKKHRPAVIVTVTTITTVAILGATTLRPWFATGFGNLNDSVCLKTQLPWLTCDSGVGISTLPNGVRIGLITNNAYGPFDQSTLNQNELNIEELIFGENRRACTGQHITLVIVTMLSRTVEDPLSSAQIGLQELQGSYLAQLAYNNTQPAIKICLAIANVGTANTASKETSFMKSDPANYSLPQVIHQIAQFAHTDSSVSGVVGLPYSQQTKETLNLIKDYQDLSAIPIISASASDELSDKPHFYLIASPSHSQGTALAQFFCDSLIQSQSSDFIAMLRDDKNAYSRNFQSVFNAAVNSINCGDPTHRKILSYTTGDPDSIRQAVREALDWRVKYILFPDYDQNMDTVELEIHRVLQDHASDITILGGGGINNVDATTHYSYTRVYATSSAGPLQENDPVAKSFVEHGFSKHSSVNAIPSHLWIPKDTLLIYDAVKAFAQTVKNMLNEGFTQDTLNMTLENISFDGTSGQVTFQGNTNNGHRSDRQQGYIYITCNDLAHNIHLVAKYNTINDGSNSPPQKLSLSQADGASTCP